MADVQIVLTGKGVSQKDLAQFLGLAREYGFNLQQVNPLKANIRDLNDHLRMFVKSRNSRPDCFNRFQGLSLFDLGRVQINGFFGSRVHRPITSRCSCLEIETIVLQLMRDRNLRFVDYDPAEGFITRIDGCDDLTTRTRNCLLRAGLRWLEQTTTLTKDDFQGISNLGPVSVDEIERRLGMQFREY